MSINPNSRRLPRADEFPPDLKPILHPSLSSTTVGQISNIMLFLPGLGDTATNFSSFPRTLNLPDTLAITLEPPFPLPAPINPGSSWSKPEDLIFDPSSGQIDAVESNLIAAVEIVAKKVVIDVLMRKCCWPAEAIHLFGYGIGGTLAMRIPLAVQEFISSATDAGTSSTLGLTSGLGSVMSIGGPLSLNTPLAKGKLTRDRTPILLLGGTKRALFGGGDGGESLLKRTRDRYEFVEAVRWKKSDDTMPVNREEVLPMMQFWGRSLKSRRGVPEGAIEVK